MKFKLDDFHYNVSESEILDDLKKSAEKLGRNSLTSREYDEIGTFTSGTIHRRFGSWNKALKKAGLGITLNLAPSEKELFENLEHVWVSLGRQPRDREMQKPISKFSKTPYLKKFGTWRKALELFVEFINSVEIQSSEPENVKEVENSVEIADENETVVKHKTKRTPSERLKVQVLMRDGNICRLCGIIVTGENIHFDHIFPWSKGGETTLENLQILCAPHNLAKGNSEYQKK